MPNRSRKLSPQSSVVIAASCVILLLLVLSLTAGAAAQGVATPQLTPGLSNLRPTETLNPQMLPSLTGVNGQAANASVIIRSGPGVAYPPIGSLAQGRWIDIVGWTGWPATRVCSPDFQHDLDMWVQVQVGERRGWIARCVLDIRGKIAFLPIVNASGERVLQR